jgi:integrase
MVAIPASITGTKRVRRYFSNREAALAYVVRVKQNGFLGAEGAKSDPGKPTLAECSALWLAKHESDGIGIFQVRTVLNRLVKRFGRDAIDSISHVELDSFFRSLRDRGLGPTTVHNHWRITRRFFNYCRDYLEVVNKNPFAKLKERPREHVEPHILTPAEMKSCLEAASGDRRSLAFLCLGGFAGLRTAEILRLQWSDLDWVGGEIFVRQPKRVAAWRPRRVHILDALRRHLEPLALKDESKVILGGHQRLYLLRKEMMNQLGWERWPLNCLRHSFKSYHYSHFGSNELTAKQCGHAGGVSFYVYGSPVVKADAEAWWTL